MSIEFINAPTGVSSVASLPPVSNLTKILAGRAIRGAWNDWLSNGNAFPLPVVRPCALADMAKALLLDNKNAMPLTAAQGLITSFVAMQGPDLVYQPYLGNLSQRLKSVGSELVAMSASIAAAWTEGLHYMGCRSDVNQLFGQSVWQKPWDGNGPDFLSYDSAGNATFLEVKGSLSGPTAPTYPVTKEFVDHKLQSINARLALPAFFPPVSARFVLSRVGRNAVGKVSVQWFNDRQAPENADVSEPCAPLALAVALSNAYLVLRALDVQVILSENRFDVYLGPFSRTQGRALQGMTKDFSEQLVFLHAEVAETLYEAQRWFHTYRRTAEPDPAMLDAAMRLWNELNEQMDPETQASAVHRLADRLERPVVQLPLGFAATM